MCRLKKYDIKKSDRRLLDANNDEMPCLGTIDMEFEPYQGAILNGVHGSSKTILKAYVIRELPANVLLGENFWNLVKAINVHQKV